MRMFDNVIHDERCQLFITCDKEKRAVIREVSLKCINQNREQDSEDEPEDVGITRREKERATQIRRGAAWQRGTTSSRQLRKRRRNMRRGIAGV